MEKQITSGSGGRILTNCNAWSPDSQWIVYDTRSDALGAVFDGQTIAMVNVETGETRRLYTAENGAYCGAATFHPHRMEVVFILGPENPTADWQYGPSHRQGVLVDADRPEQARNLDARDLAPPFTPGALRGGSHVHVFSPDGLWVSFTYNDHLLAQHGEETQAETDGSTDENDVDQRNVGVSVPIGPVHVSRSHPRSHDGAYFSVLATRTTSRPRPGSDDITLVNEEGWIGADGYVRPDGTRQRRALAFQGHMMTAEGQTLAEVYVVDLPDDVTVPLPDGPLQGALMKRPLPPLGTSQRRLTYTEGRAYPGIQGPRHWLRSSPTGAQIAFLMRDESGVVQIYTVSPNGVVPRQVTRDAWSVASAFTWSADGRYIAYAADNSVFVVEADTGISRRLTTQTEDADAPLPLACVFAPDGSKIAYMRRVPNTPAPNAPRSNQIFVTDAEV